MKIFVVCTRLCYGGAERVGVMLANGLSRNGHQVFLVSNLFEEVSYRVDNQIQMLNLVAVNENKLKKWSSSIGLMRNYLKEYRPDVVIGILNTCSLISKIAGIGLQIPIIMTEHDAFERPSSAPFTFWKWFVKFKLNKIYKHVTVLTEVDRKIIEKRLKNVYVMPNPLALTPIKMLMPKEKIILAAGRLEDWHYKGFDILIKAWGRIAYKYKDWKLQIAGIGTEEQKNFLQTLVEASRIDNSQFQLLGFREDIEVLYRRSEIFVLSSRCEGFGLVLIEAMSQGCACVACDYKGRQQEIITSCDEGMLCTLDDPIELSLHIEKLIQSPKLRESVQQNGVRRAEFYSLGNIIDKWEKLLNIVVNK